MARCLALRDIPCIPSPGTKTRMSNLVLGFPHIGWAYAPYKKPMKNGKPPVKDPSILKLYELAESTPTSMGGRWNSAVNAYTFEKATNQMDKGKRDSDNPIYLRVGHVLTTFLNDFHYGDDKKGLFPEGLTTIPEYSTIDLHVSVTHNASNGYALKVVKIALHKSSLFSYMFDGSLLSIPTTRDASEQIMRSVPESSRLAVQCLEQTVSTFLVRNVKCCTSYDEDVSPFIRVHALDERTPVMEGGSSEDVIDLPKSVVARYLNAPTDDMDYILAFLDTASAVGALSILVTRDEYFCKSKSGGSNNSPYRGAPIVDVDMLLDGVGPDAFIACGETKGGCYVPLPLQGLGSDMKSPAFEVSLTPSMYTPEDASVNVTPTFSLWHPRMASGLGYAINLVDRADGSPTVVSFVYIPSSTAGGTGARSTGRNKVFKRPFSSAFPAGEAESQRMDDE